MTYHHFLLKSTSISRRKCFSGNLVPKGALVSLANKSRIKTFYSSKGYIGQLSSVAEGMEPSEPTQQLGTLAKILAIVSLSASFGKHRCISELHYLDSVVRIGRLRIEGKT